MSNVPAKCSRCGAPIQWDKFSVGKNCEYCGQPVTGRSQYIGVVGDILNKTKLAFRSIPIPSKDAVSEKGRNLLKKQKLLSDSQVDFLGKQITRLFSRKKNVVLLFAIPIGLVASWKIYMRVNYPQTAKPFYPDLPYRAPLPEETGEFVLYATEKSKASIAYKKAWCTKYRRNKPLAECIDQHTQRKDYYDIGSKREAGDWNVYKVASSKGGEEPSTENLFDLAINCSQVLIAYYQTGGMNEFYERQSRFPSQYGKEEEKQYLREKPEMLARRMGKLWWITNYSYMSDIEDGEYIAWHKQILRRDKKILSERLADKKACGLRKGFEHKCTAQKRKDMLQLWRRAVKRSKDDLAYEKIQRKHLSVQYDALFKKVCKRSNL